MTDADSRINPFRMPGWPPMRPLCPWQETDHREYYVSVDSTETAYQEFVAEMGDLALLRREGQLVLVTGDTGCGKTALVHRCADWVRDRAATMDPAFTAEIIDLTATLKGRHEQLIAERMAFVCARLFVELNRRGLLRPDAAEELRDLHDKPDTIYPLMSDALADQTILVVLLPVVELADEVIRYATFAGANVLFFVESSELHKDEASEIVGQLEQWVPPIALHVGELRDGDARLFAEHRLTRHASLGPFPSLATDAIETVGEMFSSVGELHRTFLGTYETKRRTAAQYDAEQNVTLQDIVLFRVREPPRGGGRDRSG